MRMIHAEYEAYQQRVKPMVDQMVAIKSLQTSSLVFLQADGLLELGNTLKDIHE